MWFSINFSKYQRKFDKTQMSHALDVGYELQASLLVYADTGEPIARAGRNLLTKIGEKLLPKEEGSSQAC
ncbi:hypothetical protein AB4525_18540 [Vibrio breoganii]